MKKRKTYEVSVINKTYSKTYSDQTKFYTSDTALELNFQLKEVEYDFDSAEIILLNVDDRSLVTRPVAKNADGFTYELEDDIVAHYGEWKGQLKFDEGGEIYVSSPVGFRIENDLTNDRPPQLTEVNTWKNLRVIADGLIADIRSELVSVAEQLSEIEGEETTRQQAETQRALAETSRASAEEQRKTDHANRSAELDGKADKVVLKNEVINGNFKKGLENWSNATVQATLSIENDNLKVTYMTKVDNLLLSNVNNVAYKDNLYYSIVRFNPANLKGSVRLRHNNDYRTTQPIGIQNEFQTVSAVFNGTGSGNHTEFRMFALDTKAGDYFYIDYFMLFDLTTIFGAGNEPTKEEMDELIKVTGYIDGEYALNNKEMLGHLMKGIREKANKKQEDWITLPLFNGAQHGNSPLKVMKDEMGFVHFKGSLTNLVTGNKVFSLPKGYGPDIGVTESFMRFPVVLNSGMNHVQINYIGDGYIYNSSATQVAFFDGVSYLAKRS